MIRVDVTYSTLHVIVLKRTGEGGGGGGGGGGGRDWSANNFDVVLKPITSFTDRSIF